MIYKFIGKFMNPEDFIPHVVLVDFNGMRITGFDKDGAIWQTTFPGYVCHMYWQESFTIATDEYMPEIFSHVYEYVNSEFLASFVAAGGNAKGLRHFTYAARDDYFDIIATDPPIIEKLFPKEERS